MSWTTKETGWGKRSISAVTFQFHPWLKCYFLLFQTDYHTRALTPPTRSFFHTPFTYASSLLSESLEQATTWLKPWPPGKSTSLELNFSKFFLSQFKQGKFKIFIGNWKNSIGCLSVNWLTFRQDKRKLHDSPSPPLQSLLSTFPPNRTGGRACVSTLTS